MRLFPLLLASALLFPANAFAWVQTYTCGEVGDPCLGSNVPLPTYWPTPCITFHLNEKGSKYFGINDLIKITNTSIETWNRPKDSALALHLAGVTNEDRVGYNPYINDNTNIIVFRDDKWDESRSIMALTSVTYQNSSGKIFDADIEINTKYWPYGIYEKDGPNVVDYQNTLTHELGHVFGLAHSDDEEATMFPYSSTGETNLRTLGRDDVLAIRAIYPPTGQQCTFSDYYFTKPPYEMNEAPPQDNSCAATPRQKHTTIPLLPIAFLLLFFAYKRRKSSI